MILMFAESVVAVIKQGEFAGHSDPRRVTAIHTRDVRNARRHNSSQAACPMSLAIPGLNDIGCL